jgi:hypothetical protein
MNLYDQQAFTEVLAWKKPKENGIAKFFRPVTERVGQAADWAAETRVGSVVAKAAAGAVASVNDASAWSVRTAAILAEYRADGHLEVSTLDDIGRLSLKDVEKTVGFLDAKYRALAFAEGALTGTAGLPGIVADIPALIALTLRAANEYATYYGFDVSLETERYLVLTVLVAATGGDAIAKQVAMNEVAKAVVMAAKKKPWDELQRIALVRLIQKLAQHLGIRLTKAKLAQVLPVVGSAVGGGFNAWYISKVCLAARMVYRERFLRQQYGEQAVPFGGEAAVA